MFRGIAILAAVTSLATATQAQLGPTLYRLDAPTSFEEGCQPPCLCPIVDTDDLFGTFTLEFTAADPAGYVHYALGDVNWEIDMLGPPRRVTGSGEYKVGGQFAIMHQLQLDLSFDGAAPVHFDSGLILGGSSFPVLDIAIARNGFFCWDQVFHLQASPVPASELVPYGLAHSQYYAGCLPPCVCPLQGWRAAGGFELLDLGPANDPALQHYALVGIDWQTTPAPAPPEQAFGGFGIYRVDAGAALQRLVCDLTDGNGLTQVFDSGTVAGGDQAPARIDVALAVNGFVCLDQVFRLRALP